MVEELGDLTEYLLRNGYVHCIDCNEVLRKCDLSQHCEREHKKIHHPESDQDSEVVESIDANNNVLKDIKPKNGSNPFNQRPIDANVVIENIEASTRLRGKDSFFSSFESENISPNAPVKSTTRLAINFPAKAKNNVSFDEKSNNYSDQVDEAANLIDFCVNGDDGKIIADILNSTVLSESVSSNGSNPFRVKIEKPFDLENFKWNSEAGQNVVKAKNAHDNDDDDDGSMMVILSTSSEPDAMNVPEVNVDMPEVKSHKFDMNGSYFVHCRGCNNKVVSNTWHLHMKRTHNVVVDPDCVPDCVNDNMKVVFCKKCQNIMPRSSFEDHMNRRHHSNNKMIGVIMRGGPDDDAFNKMVKNGNAYAKDGKIFYYVKENN